MATTTVCQLVTGAPGAGKSTYCDGMQQFLSAIHRPDVHIVNLDPAADSVSYTPSIDVRELITVDEVMDELQLGPNGALLYCMEFLETNIDWLLSKLRALPSPAYIVVDCPGQVELYAHHDSLKRVIELLTTTLKYQIVVVHLTDVQHCADASNFISTVLLSLSVMINLELPYLSVLSKLDMLEQYGELDFDLDVFTDLDQLRLLADKAVEIDDDDGDDNNNNKTNTKTTTTQQHKHAKMLGLICDLIDDYNMLSFQTLAVMEKESMRKVLQTIDKAVGYVVKPNELSLY